MLNLQKFDRSKTCKLSINVMLNLQVFDFELFFSDPSVPKYSETGVKSYIFFPYDQRKIHHKFVDQKM